ncbi:hypothetical protein LC147_12060 [Vibrio harveyi]|uniref:hypothetical protein n=1 Tax=Vibrio harveyi TaxID=669 RepID=UPI003BB71371
MSYGLIDVGRHNARTSMASLADAAKEDQQRKNTNKQLKDQYKRGIASGMGTGAALGMMTPLGPVGAAIGAVAGGLLASAF